MKNTKVLVEELEQGKYDSVLLDLYVDAEKLDYQRKRYIETIKKYEETFGEGEVEIYSAPGRSEVGGNHTDHQHGMVLATSINLDALAVVGASKDENIHVMSEGYDMVDVEIDDLEARHEEEGTTAALIRGVTADLKGKGYEVKGFQAYVTSDVLIGAGLSSSAAFEVIVGTILSGMFNDGKIDPVVIAQSGQFAENVYFGKPCGLMDQMACSVGGMIHIDFKNPEEPVVEKVPSDFEAYQYSLCIVDTKASHADLTDDYAQIPADMKKVAKFFKKNFLREVPEEEFYNQISAMRGLLGDRPVLRAIHFMEEETRVQKEVDSLKAGDFKGFLELVKESGNSSFKYLQNVYTTNDLNQQVVSVALAGSERILGKHGVCRVHGGGFAGTIQAFVENDFVEEYKRRMDKVFGHGSCQVLKVRQKGGVKVLG